MHQGRRRQTAPEAIDVQALVLAAVAAAAGTAAAASSPLLRQVLRETFLHPRERSVIFADTDSDGRLRVSRGPSTASRPEPGRTRVR
jgi:hypothetical protein